MKKRPIILLSLALSLILSSCSLGRDTDDPNQLVDEKSNTEIAFSFMEGVTALSVAQMINDDPQIGEGYKIKYEILNSPDLLSTRVIKREADIAIVPTTLAAQSYNKDLGYVICGTSTWGNLYIVGREELTSLDDLKGKTLHTFGRGLTPDVILKLILLDRGLDMEEDLDLVYLNSAAEVAPLLLSGKTDLALLPEPVLSSVLLKNPDLKVLFSLNDLWMDSVGVSYGYPQSSLVIKEDLIINHPEFVEDFLKIYQENIDWAMENPDDLGELSEVLSLGPAKDGIISGIERLGIGNFNIEDSVEEYNLYYSKINEFAPEFIGGKVPDERIYYKNK